MISLLKFLDLPWDQARGYLREDLDHLEAALNQRWAALAGDSNVINVATTVTGTLAVGHGGTGVTSFTAHGVILGNGTSALSVTAAGTTNNALIGVTGADPIYGKIGLTTHVSGILPVANGGTNSSTALSGSTITISNGTQIVQGAAGTTVTVLHGNAGGAPTYGSVVLTTDVSGTLPVGNGGSGAATFTAHGVLLGNGSSAFAVTAVGATGTVLIGNTGVDPSYSDAPTLTTSVTTPLHIGGTAIGSTLTLKSTTANGTTDAIVFTVGNNGATEGMRVLNGGFVGIGTTVPTSKLVVAGSTSASPNAYVAVFRTTDDANNRPIIRIESSASAELARWDYNGALTAAGITSTLSYILSVAVGNIIVADYNGANVIRIGDTNGKSSALSLMSNGTEGIKISTAQKVGVNVTNPTALLHIKAGTATANTAPLKFNSGTVLTTAEAGALEFNTDDFFATITTGAARKAFILDNGSRLTSGKMPIATTNGRLIDLTASSAYTPTNVTTDRSYDANATTLDEISDVLGTLIADLQTKGILG